MARRGSVDIYEPFEVIIKRWALEANQQLHDTFRTQHIFDGTSNAAAEVYPGYYKRNKLNIYRQRLNPQAQYWVSTGQSYDRLNVSVLNPSMIDGVIDFRTTLQMLYVEAGVGANGRDHARGRDIKVNREKPYKIGQRYTLWNAGKGNTHRPSVRQQVNLLSRRLRWLARKHFLYDLSTWLTFSLGDEVTKDDAAMQAWVQEYEREVWNARLKSLGTGKRNQYEGPVFAARLNSRGRMT